MHVHADGNEVCHGVIDVFVPVIKRGWLYAFRDVWVANKAMKMTMFIVFIIFSMAMIKILRARGVIDTIPFRVMVHGEVAILAIERVVKDTASWLLHKAKLCLKRTFCIT